MGACLTSACISLAIARLTRSIWRSLQGSPLLPSLAHPSMAQLDLVATVCPHPHTQSAPSLDPIRAPAIMSSLIWTCHTSPDTYPRHAVTFCPVGAKKHSGGFLPLRFSPALPVVLFSLFVWFFLFLSCSFPLAHTLPASFYHFPLSSFQTLSPCNPTCFSPLLSFRLWKDIYCMCLSVFLCDTSRENNQEKKWIWNLITPLLSLS